MNTDDESYSDGKLNPDDEGDLSIRIGIEDGRVIVDFGKPVAWIGMLPEGAIDLAHRLVQKAIKAAYGGNNRERTTGHDERAAAGTDAQRLPNDGEDR